MRRRVYPWLIAASLCSGAPLVSAVELAGSVVAQGRLYSESALYAGQTDANASIALQPEFYHQWDRGWQGVTFQPFFRWDESDDQRTHFDIRQLYYLKAARLWELRVGVDRVFWGVAESQHLIDIINQADLVENTDEEDRLGQPMVWGKWIHDLGTLDLFLLTGFRERTFPGEGGRPRFPLLIDTDAAEFESDAEAAHLDVAARWSRSIGQADLGLAHFHGTSREPRLLLRMDSDGNPFLIPFYDQIDQSSLDAQLITGGWLWKLEALRRAGQESTFTAAVGGFEYTLVGILGHVWDLGLLAEYHFDDRGDQAQTFFEDDVFIGGRWALNDVASSALLAGAIVDLEGDGTAWIVEGSRRVGDRYSLSLELRALTGTVEGDLSYPLRRDDYIQLELERFF